MQPGPSPSPPVSPRPQVRPGRVVLAAFLTQFIAIAAADNQWVAQRVSDHALDHQGTGGFDLAASLLTYQWRFAPAPNDVFHSLYGQWALLAVVLLGTALLVLGISRGPATFARVLFGTWAGVIAFTGAGSVVRGFIANKQLTGGQNRAQFAFFSGVGPQQFVFFAGLVLGLLTGLAAATAAVVGRGSLSLAPSPDGVAGAGSGPGLPVGGVPAAGAPIGGPPVGGMPVEAQPTTHLPAVPTHDLGVTQQLPAVAAHDPEATQQLPVTERLSEDPEATQQWRAPERSSPDPEATQQWRAPERSSPDPEATQQLPAAEDPRRE